MRIDERRRLSPPFEFLMLIAAPAIWFACFLVVYGLNAARCAFGIEASLVGINVIQSAIALATVLTLMALLALGISVYRRWNGAGRELAAGDRPERREAERLRFLSMMALILTILAIVATIWVLIPVWAVPACS